MVDSQDNAVALDLQGKIAIITLNLPEKLNALTPDLFYRLASHLRQTASRDDIFVTVLIGKGRFFSAGADVGASTDTPQGKDPYHHWLSSFGANNLELAHAFYTHPKILVTALSGPAVGGAAALIALSDFIYAAPHAYIYTPFASLGLVSEVDASHSLVQRLGVAKANEALILGRRISAQELLRCGFVNKVLEATGSQDGEFLDLVLKEVEDIIGGHLVQSSLLKIKALIRKPYVDVLNTQNLEEVFAGLDGLVAGIPQQMFQKKLAETKIKNKL